MFVVDTSGDLVGIVGTDPNAGRWRHKAFVPNPLPDEMPSMSATTFLAVADARAALAALDSTARQLPEPDPAADSYAAPWSSGDLGS